MNALSFGVFKMRQLSVNENLQDIGFVLKVLQNISAIQTVDGGKCIE